MSGPSRTQSPHKLCAPFVHIDQRSEPVSSRPRSHTTSSPSVPGAGIEPALHLRGRGV